MAVILAALAWLCLAAACAPGRNPTATPFPGLPTPTALPLPTLPPPVATPNPPSGPAARTVTRAVIYLDGLGSSSSGAPKTFADLSQALQPLYKRSLFFSYRKGSTSYTNSDTFSSIQDSVAVLQAMVQAEVKKDPTLKFDLIGQSLGGVVAFEFAEKLAADRNPLLFNIGSVVTTHSPLNGSLLLRSVPLWPDWVKAVVARLWGAGAAQSPAAQDLGQMNRNELLPAINAQWAQDLRAQGVQVLALASKDDVVVCVDDAMVAGVTKVYALGNHLPPDVGLPCALLVTRSVAVTGDASEFAGHSQILHSKDAIADLKAALTR